nr:MAG TPA: hypothetical protein [Caudoviricetes sp.]
MLQKRLSGLYMRGVLRNEQTKEDTDISLFVARFDATKTVVGAIYERSFTKRTN